MNKEAKRLPSAVLFICTQNAIRSPMAAAITHHLLGHRVYVASAGIEAGDPDPFVGLVMDEIGLDLTRHRPHALDDLADAGFDLAITLSPQAKQHADELARTTAISVEHWPVADPSLTHGSREQILDAYRAVRDDVMKRVKQRFELPA